MKVELDDQLVYSILWEAFEVMDKEEFSNRVEEVYAECSQIIVDRIKKQLDPISDAEIVEDL